MGVCFQLWKQYGLVKSIVLGASFFLALILVLCDRGQITPHL